MQLRHLKLTACALVGFTLGIDLSLTRAASPGVEQSTSMELPPEYSRRQ
jgi:hypothetical protein